MILEFYKVIWRRKYYNAEVIKIFRVLWVLQNEIFTRLFLYISLPLGRACYTLLIYASAIDMPGMAGRYSTTDSNAGLAEYLPASVWQGHK